MHGLAALLTAQFYSPAQIIVVDRNEHMLKTARDLGATDLVNNRSSDAVEQILKITHGRGVD
jgi:alcohol dehydrogenase